MPESKKPPLSVVVPVYQGESLAAAAVAEIISHLAAVLPDVDAEIIAVDDGSTDGSYARLRDLQKQYPRQLRVIRLSRNFGAFAALQAGLDTARGECIAVLPQDLQETPAMVADMFRAWRNDGIKINLTTRTAERDEPWSKKTLAAVYHFLFRAFVMPDYPRGGLGIFLIDRQVADELRQNPPRNVDFATYLFSLGYSRKLHSYPRPRSAAKKSNWTLGKNIKLAIDNFIGFSFLPIRLMSATGILIAFAGFVFAAYVFVGKLTGWYPINQPPGWATIVVLLAFLGGLIMTMLGVIGEYLWRILDATRRRPPYLVDEITDETEARQNAPADDGRG